MPRDFASYPTLTQDALRSLLGSVCAELADLHEEWAMAENARLSSRVRAYETSGAETETGRGRFADAAALPNTMAVNEVKGKIAALIEERDFLRELLNG